ncbi:hypothetical protein [Oryza sativa Japonica Group]|uniref:Uncharacterized protein n=2 Tax=Oryza sativa subsp. japonica TaxID=39947 RepID=A0A0P0V9I0_ORYSJ|nr:hypothetical protein [Oryza sativa Japonica Group]BAB90393.1 P0432B10.11 [Oryza sativa Japonica Group]BAD82680.1 hypothetical protein [Oryza sativa Japonica Group]BAS74891.1 Os01g0813200 [Oryza sativa Japonica Group]
MAPMSAASSQPASAATPTSTADRLGAASSQAPPRPGRVPPSASAPPPAELRHGPNRCRRPPWRRLQPARLRHGPDKHHLQLGSAVASPLALVAEPPNVSSESV